MANNVIKRKWNMNSMVQIEDLTGMTFQDEAAGHTFEISAIDDAGNAVALSGTPAGVFLRPDNTDQALTCSVSNGKVYATLPAGCYDIPGRFGLTIFLTSNSQTAAIYAAVGTVARTSSGTASPGTTQDVVDLINAINAAIAQIPASDTNLKAAMAHTYSTSALYAVGDYAWYNGVLYKCITAITSGETWTSSHWTAANMGGDVSALKSAITTVDDNAHVFPYFDIETGKRLDSSGNTTVASLFVVTDFIDCLNTKAYLLKNNVGNAFTCDYAFYDSNEIYIPNTYKSVSLIGFHANVPSGAKYVRFSYSINASKQITIETVNQTNSKYNLNYLDFVQGSMEIDGITPVSSNLRIRGKEFIPVIPDCDYKIKANVSDIGIDEGCSYLKIGISILLKTNENRYSWIEYEGPENEFHTPSDCKYIGIIIAHNNTASVITPEYLDSVIVEANTDGKIVNSDDLIHEESEYIHFEDGTIGNDRPTKSVQNYPRIRSKGYLKVIPGDLIRLDFACVPEKTIWATVSCYADKTLTRVNVTEPLYSGETYKIPNGINYVRFVCGYDGNTSIEPSDIKYFRVGKNVSVKQESLPIRFFEPIPTKKEMNYVQNRTTNQDIAVYNGNFVECDVGFIKINGGSQISIDNGHGNNANFGATEHGDLGLPYLYCPSWGVETKENGVVVSVTDNKRITVYELTSSGATKAQDDIEYDALPDNQHLEAVVDEAGGRAYIFMNDDPFVGNITFYVGDLSGNLLTEGKRLDFQIKIIQGMTFCNGYIYMVSGSTNVAPDQYFWIFDTEGNLINKALITTDHEIEGVSFDPVANKLYVARIDKIFSE